MGSYSVRHKRGIIISGAIIMMVGQIKTVRYSIYLDMCMTE